MGLSKPNILEPTEETVVQGQEFVPCGARLVILEDKFKYEGLIKVPGQAERRPTTGTVIAIGPDVPRKTRIEYQESEDVSRPPTLVGIEVDDGTLFKIGDHVLYASFAGTLVESRRTKRNYRIISYDEILAKLPKEEITDLEAR